MNDETRRRITKVYMRIRDEREAERGLTDWQRGYKAALRTAKQELEAEFEFLRLEARRS